MTLPPSIPSEYRPLISALRSAVHDLPADATVRSADWTILFRQAQQHGVDTFLYPWLAVRIPDLFSAQASVSAQSAPAAWRAFFLDALANSLQRQRQLEALLCAFDRSHVAVVPLKGAWLSETVYDDPVRRSMSDLDLLVHESDCDTCHSLFHSLGYFVKQDVRHNAYASDQTYYHPSYRWFVELHWTFASDMDKSFPKPDIDAIWRNTTLSELRGHPVRILSPEDQLAHLAQHILHHHFAIPIRAYLDIAVYLKRFGHQLQPDRLATAAARWKIGSSLPFILDLVSDLFDIQPPAALPPAISNVAPEYDTRLFGILFDLPEARERDGETTLLRFQHASAIGRIKLILARIFMPRAFLLPTYPCARHFYGLPLAWFYRAMRLVRNNQRKIKSMRHPDSATAHTLANAEMRMRTVELLLRETKKPE